jgi:ABC-type glycerol-3-phosphate transport system permease component
VAATNVSERSGGCRPLGPLCGQLALYLVLGGLAILGQGNYVQRGITMAAVIASLPPLVLYIIFQRRIVAGISTTGLAGR